MEIKWKNGWPMRQLRPETGESHAIFFKTLIQLYLFCLFLYFWLTISKRVSKAIFLDITFESVVLWGSYGLKQGNPLYFFQNTDPIVFFSFLYFWLTISNRVSKAIFLDITFKSVGLWGRYGMKQGNPLQYLKFSNQIVFGST